MPEIIIVAGPNGAGKTSFANEYLPLDGGSLAYVNADEIARSLSSEGHSDGALDFAAGRRMLASLDALAERGSDVMLETTLATLSYAVRIPRWRSAGYRVALVYLRLASVEAALLRVQKRVKAGGHSIPEGVVRRRYARSLDYLERVYKPIVDEWSVWDSREGEFVLLETSGE